MPHHTMTPCATRIPGWPEGGLLTKPLCRPGTTVLRRLTAAALLLGASALPVAALEVSGSFQLGNNAFALDRAETNVTFPGDLYQWGADVSVKQAITDDFTFTSSVQRELILRNTVYNTLTYRQGFLRIGVGPFFGLFNSSTAILKPGITTSVQLELAGLAFVSFRSDSSIGGRLVEIGDYTQERSDISAGLYVKNVIISGLLQTRKFSQKTATDVETVDTLSVYAFQTDIYRKNTPYKLLLTFGYHQLARSYVHPTETVQHVLNSIVLGTRLDLYLTPFLSTTLDLESSMYTFGNGELLGISNPGPGGYLFRAYAGVTFDLDRQTRTE
jgi:hypothetical protein